MLENFYVVYCVHGHILNLFILIFSWPLENTSASFHEITNLYFITELFI